MYLSLNKAAKEAGISKSTLSEALNSGRLTANKDDRGRWQIDPAALFQVFPKTTPNEQPVPQPNTESNTDLRIEIAELRATLDAEKRLTDSLTDQIDDLRKRLDTEGEERRKMTAMLTDQRAGQGAPADTIAVPSASNDAQEAHKSPAKRKNVFSRVAEAIRG